MRFVTLDVFTDTTFLGNPLAVVIVEDKDRAALEKKKKEGELGRKEVIAKEFNLSETVFLHLRPGETLESPDRTSGEREIGIFTIEGELPFAGHPTIGTTYFLLKHLGWDFIHTLLPSAGPIRISSVSSSITTSSSSGGSGGGGGGGGGAVAASIPHDVHIHAHTLRSFYEQGDAQAKKRVEKALHESDEAIRTAELDAPVVSIVRGMAFVLVKLPSLEHLGRVTAGGGRLALDSDGNGSGKEDNNSSTSLLDKGPWGYGFVARYYYVPQEIKTDTVVVAAGEESVRRTEIIRTRMVELSFEDPATGSAASALSCYLNLASGAAVDEVQYLITQGVEIGRKSDIEVTVFSAVGEEKEGKRVVKEVKLGGTAKVVMTGDIEI